MFSSVESASFRTKCHTAGAKSRGRSQATSTECWFLPNERTDRDVEWKMNQQITKECVFNNLWNILIPTVYSAYFHTLSQGLAPKLNPKSWQSRPSQRQDDDMRAAGPIRDPKNRRSKNRHRSLFQRRGHFACCPTPVQNWDFCFLKSRWFKQQVPLSVACILPVARLLLDLLQFPGTAG